MNTMDSFTLAGAIKSAWKNLHGTKGKIWLSVLILFVLNLLISYIVYRTTLITPTNMPYWAQFYAAPLISAIFYAPFFFGALLVAIKKARNEPITSGTIFQGFRHWFSLLVAVFILSIVLDLGWNALALLYNGVILLKPNWLTLVASMITVFGLLFFCLAPGLVVDKGFSPWQAISASFQVTRRAWGRIFVLFLLVYIMLMLIYLLSMKATPLLNMLFITHSQPIKMILTKHISQIVFFVINLVIVIWFIPFAFNLLAAVYHGLVDKPLETME